MAGTYHTDMPSKTRSLFKKLIIDGKEADRLRFMFQGFAEGPSLSRLRGDLHRRGRNTRSGKPTQKRHKDGSVYRIPYCRCTRTLHFDNSVCRVKHINADIVEGSVVQKLSDLIQNEAFLTTSVEELNADLKRKTEPLEREAKQIKERLEQIEGEVGRYVKLLGQGKLSIERLEAEIGRLETDKRVP